MDLISELETGYSIELPSSSEASDWAMLVLEPRKEARVSANSFNPWKPQDSSWKRWNTRQDPKLDLPGPWMQWSKQEEGWQLDPEAVIRSTCFLRTSTPKVTVVTRLLVHSSLLSGRWQLCKLNFSCFCWETRGFMVYTRTQYIHQFFGGSTVNTCLAILTNYILMIRGIDMIEILGYWCSKITEIFFFLERVRWHDNWN